MGNILSGIATDWGFNVSDIWSSSMGIFATLAAFILLGITINYVPTLIDLIKSAILYQKNTGNKFTMKDWADEFSATHAERKYKKSRGRR